MQITSEDDLHSAVRPGSRVHVLEEGFDGSASAYLGSFVIQHVGRPSHASSIPAGAVKAPPELKSAIKNQESGIAQSSVTSAAAADGIELHLRPEQTMGPEALEKLSVSTGPWMLSTQPPGHWPSHFADEFARQERIPVETFLLIDPLVSLSTVLAAKTWMFSLWGAVLILAACILIPRGFCGYLCPLGTLIDLFDWAIAGRVKRFRVPDNGWWVHVKYYLLVGVLVAGLFGVLLSGFVSAIPVLTRGLLFILAPLQLGLIRGWHQVPPIDLGQGLSIALFFAVLALGFLRPRFWCKYVCPSGAVFSLGNLFRAGERKVEETCIHCNKCVEICPFDAIKPDFTTRVTDCTLCQTCGGVCPTHAIKFVERGNRVSLKLENDPPALEHSVGADVHRLLNLRFGIDDSRTPRRAGALVNLQSSIVDWILSSLRRLRPLSREFSGLRWLDSLAEARIGRRSFVASGVGLLAGLTSGVGSTLATKARGARLSDTKQWRPVRPPGSVPEKEFLELCIRCGECFKVCPNNVLQPLAFQQGLEGLWTPQVVADWAGCEASCNACGKACPTGAIRALPLEEKRAARIGLAIVNEKTCLPFAGKEACQLCVDECAAAGYDAIEFIRVHTQADSVGKPIEGTGFLAPKVDPDKCVGCGLCQTRCFSINAKTKKLLGESAIIIEAGGGKEDRMMSGSYRALRKQKRAIEPAAPSNSTPAESQSYLPDFLAPRPRETKPN